MTKPQKVAEPDVKDSLDSDYDETAGQIKKVDELGNGEGSEDSETNMDDTDGNIIAPSIE